MLEANLGSLHVTPGVPKAAVCRGQGDLQRGGGLREREALHLEQLEDRAPLRGRAREQQVQVLAVRRVRLDIFRRGERRIWLAVGRQLFAASGRPVEVIQRDEDGDLVNPASRHALEWVELRQAFIHDEEDVMDQLFDHRWTPDPNLVNRAPGEAVVRTIEILEGRAVHAAYFGRAGRIPFEIDSSSKKATSPA